MPARRGRCVGASPTNPIVPCATFGRRMRRRWGESRLSAGLSNYTMDQWRGGAAIGAGAEAEAMSRTWQSSSPTNSRHPADGPPGRRPLAIAMGISSRWTRQLSPSSEDDPRPKSWMRASSRKDYMHTSCGFVHSSSRHSQEAPRTYARPEIAHELSSCCVLGATILVTGGCAGPGQLECGPWHQG